MQVGVATEKSQIREWPFPGVSRCAACSVVKQAWRVVCVAAWSVHHVRALASSFVCGGDDYLFVLIIGSSQVRATSSLATALAAVAAASVALLLSTCACSAAHACPPPMALTGCGLLPHARSSRQLGWRVISGKFRSGLFPQFGLRSRALCCLVRCVCRCIRSLGRTVLLASCMGVGFVLSL